MVIQPSPEELTALSDLNFLKLKASISKKIIQHLSDTERNLKSAVEQSDFNFPKGTFVHSGKISKGENYKGFPYFVLDYPRLFSRKEVFAFRTMLWWGHEYSCTLHLGGDVLSKVTENFYQNLKRENDLYFCIADQPWEYHYEVNNYQKINNLDSKDIKNYVNRNQFIKVSRYISVNQWPEFNKFTMESFARFLMLMD